MQQNGGIEETRNLRSWHLKERYNFRIISDSAIKTLIAAYKMGKDSVYASLLI